MSESSKMYEMQVSDREPGTCNVCGVFQDDSFGTCDCVSVPHNTLNKIFDDMDALREAVEPYAPKCSCGKPATWINKFNSVERCESCGKQFNQDYGQDYWPNPKAKALWDAIEKAKVKP